MTPTTSPSIRKFWQHSNNNNEKNQTRQSLNATSSKGRAEKKPFQKKCVLKYHFTKKNIFANSYLKTHKGHPLSDNSDKFVLTKTFRMIWKIRGYYIVLDSAEPRKTLLARPDSLCSDRYILILDILVFDDFKICRIRTSISISIL